MALAGLLLLGACEPDTKPRALELVAFAQGRAERVFLNETLDFRFSEPLDPASVHPGSAQVVDAAGSPVSGTWNLERRSLSFVPQLPRTPQLEDSGFAPGRTYSVTLMGFPRVDGLRGRGGNPLAGTLRFTFRTVDDSGDSTLFVDEVFGPPAPLVLEQASFQPDAPILISAFEPIDPRSLADAEFGLIGSTGPRSDVPVDSGTNPRQGPRRFELRARLRENERGGAVIELWPLEGGGDSPRHVLDEGRYLLICERNPTALRDLGGNPVPASFGATSLDGAYLDVREQQPEGGEPLASRRVEIDFLDQVERSEAVLLEADGTALWIGDGQVTARFPMAAGDGEAGLVELPDGEWEASRTEATDLRLEPGNQCRLVADGLQVLASQGAMRIKGQLLRRVRTGPTAVAPGELAEDWMLRLRQAALDQEVLGVREFAGRYPTDRQPRLLDALEAAERDGRPWTVLVAGGDLIVTGEIFVDGPLFLVAGGWVRLAGRVVASEVWTTVPRRGQRSLPPSEDLPFELTQPSTNPLRRPMRWSVASRALGVTGPFGPVRLLQLPGDGQAKVGFTGESTGPDGSPQVIGPVDDPSLLFDASELSFRIDLLMPSASESPFTGFRLPSVDALRFEASGGARFERQSGFGR